MSDNSKVSVCHHRRSISSLRFGKNSSTTPVVQFSFSGDFGGREKVALSLCRSMISAGCVCRLFVVVEERAGRKRNANLMRSLGDIGGFGEVFHTGSRFSPRLLLRLASRLRETGTSVLHCHCYKSLYYAELMRSFGLYRGVVVYTLHGLLMPKSSMASLIENLHLLGLHLADGVIGCSREILHSSMPKGSKKHTASIINAIEMPEENPKVILSEKAGARGSLAARFGLNPKLPVVINVGRLCEQKNYPLFIEMIRRDLSRSGIPSAGYLLVGNGELKYELEALAADRGVREHVVFTGFVSDMDVVYRGADLLVQTSIWEGTPMCLLEARSYGLPVVAPAVGGNEDVVNSGKDGFLYPVNDLDALWEGFESYVNDSPKRTRHGLRAFQNVRDEFGTKEWCRRHLDFYASIMKDRDRLSGEVT